MGRSYNYEHILKTRTKEIGMLNKVMLIGRLGQDVEMNETTSGKKVGKFSVATSEKRGQEEVTTWHNIVVWEKLAELCSTYLAKGRLCYLEGSISNRSYDAKDGTRKYITEINAFKVTFLEASQTANAPKKESPAFSADDIPF
jgi:single-strand DNA-binding protein